MRRLLAFPVAFIVLVGAGCLDDPPQVNHPIIFNFEKEKPIQTDPGSIGGVTTFGTTVTLPPVKKGETVSVSGNVVISSLTAGQTLPNPFVILGRASSVGHEIRWRVRDAHKKELASGTVASDAASPSAYGSYRVRAFYDDLPMTADGTVEVYVPSPRDGSEQDLASVPVKLTRTVTMLKIFFVDQEKDPQLLHCEQVSPVTRRVPKTENMAEAAVLELLKGPSASEQLAGNRTAVIPGTGLRSVSIVGDTATVDFTRQFVLGLSGSCQVNALRAQVEQLLKQFQGVRQVRILVEGADAESSLQP